MISAVASVVATRGLHVSETRGSHGEFQQAGAGRGGSTAINSIFTMEPRIVMCLPSRGLPPVRRLMILWLTRKAILPG